MIDKAKDRILTAHEKTEAVCKAMGINLDELKALEDNNHPNDGMEYETQIK